MPLKVKAIINKLNSDHFGRELNSMKYDEKVQDTCTSEKGRPGDCSRETTPKKPER